MGRLKILVLVLIKANVFMTIKSIKQAYNLDVNQYRAYMQHIEIAKIMHRNGVNKPLSILRDGNKDLPLMKKIFDQINCNAEKMRPPLDQVTLSSI